MQLPMEFETEITKKDYRSVVYFNVYFKKKFTFFLIITALVVCLGTLGGKLLGITNPPNYLYYSCLAFLGIAVLQLIVTEVMVNRYINTDKVALRNKKQVTVTDEYIQSCGGCENLTVQYRWDMVYAAYETKGSFLVFLNIQQAMILPKRFLSEPQQQLLRQQLTEKLGKKFRRRCK